MTIIIWSALGPIAGCRRPACGFSSPRTLVTALIVAVTAMFPLWAQSSNAQTLDPANPNQSSIDALLRPVVIDRMADRYIAGASIVVVSGDRIVYKAGFGRREVFQEIPVRVDSTIWRIGSITKVLTGVAVMQLVDRGLVRLDDDVNQYLDSVKVPDTFPRPVRVRDLLTHTGGFDQPGLGRHATSAEAVRPLEEFLAEYLRRLRPPGELAVYDTYGITLAGYLVEQVSGLTYGEYLQRNIFNPLRMSRSGITLPPSLVRDAAVGYEFAGHWEAMPWEFMNTAPASTVNATAPDMGNFIVMLLNGGRFEGRQVLSEAAVRTMLARQFTNDPEQPGYGLTFAENKQFGVPAFSHGGSMTGFGALLYLIPAQRLGVFIAYNQESETLANEVVSRLVSALIPGSGAKPLLRAPLAVDSEVARFAGSYADAVYNHRNPDQGWRRRTVAVSVGDAGQLVFQQLSATRVGAMAFQRPDGSLLTFRENAQGEITHMFLNQTVYERVGDTR